jgi:Calx-beta domain
MLRAVSRTLLRHLTIAPALLLLLAACGGGGSGTTPATSGINGTGGTSGASVVAMAASTYTVQQSSASVTLTVARTGAGADAINVDYSTTDGTAVAGANYTATSGTLSWAENDSTNKTITVPVSNATPFDGTKQFTVALSSPSNNTSIGSPGSAAVTIAGDNSPADGSLVLADATLSVAQNAGTLAVTVNRTGGSSGAASVGYVTADGTAVAGTDYTKTTGTLQWADGDASSKMFSIPVSNAVAFAGSKTFTLRLTNASGAAIGTPGTGTVTITGTASPPAGSLQLSAPSFTVVQNAGTLNVSVKRIGGTAGAVTVAYATANGTAVGGTNFTAVSGTLSWASGNATAKTISIPISNATPFSGTKSFTLALSSPTAGATIASPGSATIAISGDAAATGSLQLSAASYSVAQGAGSLSISVNRTGGSAGAVGVAYTTSNGTAVAGTDYTKASGTLQWAAGDAAAKTVSVPISNATPFSGARSFSVTLSAATGGAAVASPSTATVSINGDAVAAMGSLQLSASAYSIAQSGGSLNVTVNRTGGSSGAISVAYATANGTATAGTDYTAANGTLQWAGGDAASKTISIPVSNSTPFSGNRAFTIAISGPAGGALLSSPSTATVTIGGSAAAPVASGTLWVYSNGVFNWGGDWSFAASANYKDAAGAPVDGPFDIAITGQQWGGWQPYVNANCQSNISLCFATTPYKYIFFSAKPTVANQVFGVGFMSSGDTPDGPVLNDTSAYCSGGKNPPVGQWETCKIPIAAFSLTDTTVLKFWITDQTGLGSNHYYLDDVGFSPN